MITVFGYVWDLKSGIHDRGRQSPWRPMIMMTHQNIIVIVILISSLVIHVCGRPTYPRGVGLPRIFGGGVLDPSNKLTSQTSARLS